MVKDIDIFDMFLVGLHFYKKTLNFGMEIKLY
jgi:hypothetical protein